MNVAYKIIVKNNVVPDLHTKISNGLLSKNCVCAAKYCTVV